jgi:selenocysteine-specific translation elongation factor
MALLGNVTAVLGKGLGSSLGRKGTASDITLYNHKVNDTILSFVEPSSYPEKIQSLVSSLYMADQALIKVDAVDAYFAESVVALDALGLSRGYMILGEGVNSELVKSFIAGTVVSKYEVVEEQVVAVRDKLVKLQPAGEGEAIVQIDHSFSVRGVGTVALGVVKRGKIKKHDEVIIYPQHKRTQVKSVQVHDIDVEDATPGVRVGLSLKNVEPEDVPRGAIISTSASIKTEKRIDAEAHLTKYSKRGIVLGDVIHVAAYLNYTPARVVSGGVAAGGSGKVLLELEKEVPILPGRMLLLDPGQKPPRVFGYINL